MGVENLTRSIYNIKKAHAGAHAIGPAFTHWSKLLSSAMTKQLT